MYLQTDRLVTTLVLWSFLAFISPLFCFPSFVSECFRHSWQLFAVKKFQKPSARYLSSIKLLTDRSHSQLVNILECWAAEEPEISLRGLWKVKMKYDSKWMLLFDNFQQLYNVIIILLYIVLFPQVQTCQVQLRNDCCLSLNELWKENILYLY